MEGRGRTASRKESIMKKYAAVIVILVLICFVFSATFAFAGKEDDVCKDLKKQLKTAKKNLKKAKKKVDDVCGTFELPGCKELKKAVKQAKKRV